MKIILAKTAGFCFGVDRAVKLTYRLLDEGRRVATLGPLIHNPQAAYRAGFMKKSAHGAWRTTMRPAPSWPKYIP